MVGLPLTVTASDMVSAKVSVSPCLPTTLLEPPPALLSVTLKLLTVGGSTLVSTKWVEVDKGVLALSVAVTLTVMLPFSAGVPLKVRLAASNVSHDGNGLPSDSVAL